jgi:hypothetical protein
MELLVKTIEEFKQKELSKAFCYEKLSLQYWVNKFKDF